LDVPRRRSAPRQERPDTRPTEAADVPSAEQVSYSESSLHELFNRQVAEMLDRTDLGEEQKQALLIGLSCPCCGGAAMSFTARLRR
jgi:hypothetical protein